MSDNIREAIVPITFLDDTKYTSDNDEKHFMVDINELFVNPYNINTIYRPTTTIEPNSDIIDAYNDSIQRSKVAYIKMNVEDIVINTVYEMISDVFVGSLTKDKLSEFAADYTDVMISRYNVYNVISKELKEVKYIDITLANLYTKIICDIMIPIGNELTFEIMKHKYRAEYIYKKYINNDDEAFNKVYHSYGNVLFCNISAVIKDIIEIKMSNVRRMFDVIKQTYLNMSQFATNYHIDPDTKAITSSDNTYYEYLINDKYSIKGDDEDV